MIKVAETKTASKPAAQRVKITVPEQPGIVLCRAREEVKRLDNNSRLATLAEIVLDMPTLTNACDRYLLAADPKGLPDTAGWYKVSRSADGVSFEPVSPEASGVIQYNRDWQDLLLVDENAVVAAKGQNPVVIRACAYQYYVSMCIRVYGYPDEFGVRVALVNLQQNDTESTPQVPEGILRKVQ